MVSAVTQYVKLDGPSPAFCIIRGLAQAKEMMTGRRESQV